MKRTIPSPAQAKYLARLLAGEFCNVGGYDSPTQRALKERGWLLPTGATGEYASGTPYAVHIISDAGMDALEDFLREMRCRRQVKKP